jgi:hypothetical protein
LKKSQPHGKAHLFFADIEANAEKTKKPIPIFYRKLAPSHRTQREYCF